MRIRIAAGIGMSLLLHVLLFLFFRSHMTPQPQSAGTESHGPLVVQLNRQPLGPKTAPPAASPVPPLATREPEARPSPPAAKKRVAPRTPTPPERAAPPRVPLARRAEPRRAPSTAPSMAAPSAPAAPAAPGSAPPADMSEMVAAARERRRAAGIPSPGASSNATDSKPQGDDVARANVAFSVAQARGRKSDGGIFHITRMGVRNAEFLFRGWDNDSRAAARELVEVDAGANGDVETAIVRKMIEIIRKHESGDFSWDSHRLGRVVMLSARREDNAGLEDFLKQEFFVR
ncbi:hypothetical protein JJB74_11290 [Noviherbaspirillum sp. DKR-6]|uniref:Uncharacterized protein n=1 Tax=Noviherbaspirillum pedocola TaxID=2801341 RepID=A0A934SR33_9BURK|nr:hypothetical protein [Noviherbaspirillum pedocola]